MVDVHPLVNEEETLPDLPCYIFSDKISSNYGSKVLSLLLWVGGQGEYRLFYSFTTVFMKHLSFH